MHFAPFVTRIRDRSLTAHLESPAREDKCTTATIEGERLTRLRSVKPTFSRRHLRSGYLRAVFCAIVMIWGAISEVIAATGSTVLIFNKPWSPSSKPPLGAWYQSTVSSNVAPNNARITSVYYSDLRGQNIVTRELTLQPPNNFETVMIAYYADGRRISHDAAERSGT